MKYLFGIAVFACAFLLEFNFAQAAQPACSADVIATCEQLDQAPLNAAGDKALGFPKSDVGNVTLNAYAYLKSFGTPDEAKVKAEFKRMGPASPKQQQNAFEMADKLKRHAKALVLGLPTVDDLKETYTAAEKAKWSPEQRALFLRLDTLHVKAAKIDDESCVQSAALPNAFYDSNIHTLKICPFTFKQNPQYVAHMLSHEIGHVVSPCANALSLYRIEGAMNDDEAVGACDQLLVPPTELSRTASNIQSRYIGALRESGATHFVNDSWNSFPRELERCQLATEEDESRTPETKLFSASKVCIEKKTSSIYDSAHRGAALARAAQMKVPFEQGMKREKQESLPMCLGAASETFADAFEAQLLGAWAEKNKWTSTDVRSALLAMRGSVCSEAKTNSAFVNREEYPVASDRLKTLLNSAALSGRLGCVPADAKGICPLRVELPVDSGEGSGAKPLPVAPKTSAE